ncbi:ABC transporter substrate-binding protein [Paenochrobactrum pullorum]|uniref:ABC transporter substrate-binding protein n=1 Tax=Paenochrobactrum pullorum TaxID=1324351 RepID=UPI0035BC0B6F
MKIRTLFSSALIAGVLVSGADASVLTMCTEGSPETFNPQLTNNGVTSNVLTQIYNGLVSVRQRDLSIEPALSQAWTVSEDGTIYTFKLRENVQWQSNKEFTPTRAFNADDVVFSFARMMDKNHPYALVSGGTYIGFENKLGDLLQEVRKIDDLTVEFHLRRRDATFLGIMAFQPMSILSAEYAGKMLESGTPDNVDRIPIGTGPFQLEAYQSDSMVRLKAFHNTWGEAAEIKEKSPLVETIVMAITPDASARVQRALAGECHIALFPNLADADVIRNSHKLDLVENEIASSGFLTFNFKDSKFQDHRVREALALGLDLNRLVDVVYQGMGHPTAAIIPPMFWGHNADLQLREYNPERAKELLIEAGYPDGFSTQVWAIPVIRPYMPNGRRAAEMIQADWAKIGVKVEVISYEWAEYLERSRAGEAQVGMFGGSWDYPDPSQIPNSYFSCNLNGKPSPSNIGAWCDDEYNDVMRKAAAATSQAEREPLYKELQTIFDREIPAIILGSADALTAVNKKVKNYNPIAVGTTSLAGVSVEE